MPVEGNRHQGGRRGLCSYASRALGRGGAGMGEEAPEGSFISLPLASTRLPLPGGNMNFHVPASCGVRGRGHVVSFPGSFLWP